MGLLIPEANCKGFRNGWGREREDELTIPYETPYNTKEIVKAVLKEKNS